MKSMPQALFVVDPRKERNAIAEARKLNIPISLVLLTLTVIQMKLITLSQRTTMLFVPLNY